MRLPNQVCFKLFCYLYIIIYLQHVDTELLQSEASVWTYLIFWSIPVVDYACWDEKTVIHVAATAVIPATVIAHLGFPVGKTNGSLAACSRQKKVYDCCALTPQDKATQIKWKSATGYRWVPSFLVWLSLPSLTPWGATVSPNCSPVSGLFWFYCFFVQLPESSFSITSPLSPGFSEQKLDLHQALCKEILIQALAQPTRHFYEEDIISSNLRMWKRRFLQAYAYCLRSSSQ